MYEMLDRYIDSLVARSSPGRTVWNQEIIRDGKEGSWNYIDGCMLTALMTLGELTGKDEYLGFAERVVDHYVREDGTIATLETDKHRLDDVNEGRALFPAYRRTGKEKYRKAAELLMDMLAKQPRTPEGSYWHKSIYVEQVWLDGIYMAQPFKALYEKEFGIRDYSDIIDQIRIVKKHMRDEKTGLYYHGYDYTKSMYWADPVTGCSQCFWLRAIGWFSIALADLAEIIDDEPVRKEIGEILLDLMTSMARYADPETGMYYQVVDQGGREGNYLESSGSSMVAYAMMKGARLGVLPESFRELGRKTFDGLVRTRLTFDGEHMGLSGICLVAGLGDSNGKPRNGTYEYYISEPVVQDDAKGIAPLVLSYSEVKRFA
ncbi:MAG: glycosyl hydrolase family 88 [Clostridiales bacterium]|nr:glycosyl hydrolase family 88 [Clostridiales bacterium]